MQIAIDGPAGAGKSTIAKIIAKELNLLYLDTGAMYRAVTFGVWSAGIDWEDRAAIIDLVQKSRIRFEGHRVFWNDREVTAEIRSPEISKNIHFIADIPEVRRCLVDQQRQIAGKTSVIMDGRDICSVVLPQAEVKIFLDAAPEERARRRVLELKEKGIEKTFEEIKKDIESRDAADRSRPVGALICVPDAVVVDTTGKSIEAVCDRIIHIIKEVEQ